MTRQGLEQVNSVRARTLLLAATSLFAGGCDRTASGRPPEARGVSGAHLVLPAVPGRPGVLYFVVQSDPRYARPNDVQRLRAVSVTGVGRAEVHQSMSHGGMTMMRAMDDVPLRNGPNRFCPGGLHVMLFDIDPKLAPGGTTPIALDFGTAEPLRARATVVAFGQTAPRDEPFDCSTKI